MAFALLADFVVVVHFLFILFVVAGGFLALRNVRWTCLHVPAAVWGVLMEWTGWICPLTPLENRLRRLGGGPVYSSDFVERYIVSLIYPEALTRNEQVLLGLAVLVINGGIYGWLAVRMWRSRGRDGREVALKK